MLHINGKFTMANMEIISYVVMIRSLQDCTSNVDVYIKEWSTPSCICGILYFKLNRIYAINKITNLKIIKWSNIIYITEREIKGCLTFWSFSFDHKQRLASFGFLEKSLYDVRLGVIKARGGAQLVHIQMSTIWWKTCPPNQINILSMKNSSILMISASETFLLSMFCYCFIFISLIVVNYYWYSLVLLV